jgi:hypothetical protein
MTARISILEACEGPLAEGTDVASKIRDAFELLEKYQHVVRELKARAAPLRNFGSDQELADAMLELEAAAAQWPWIEVQ